MGQPLVPHLGYRQDNINLFNIKRTQGKIRLDYDNATAFSNIFTSFLG